MCITCSLGSRATLLPRTISQYMPRPTILTNQGAIQDAKIAEHFSGSYN